MTAPLQVSLAGDYTERDEASEGNEEVKEGLERTLAEILKDYTQYRIDRSCGSGGQHQGTNAAVGKFWQPWCGS